MGLYITPGGAQWAYSGFMDFRRRLAKRIGIVLEFMPEFTPCVGRRFKLIAQFPESIRNAIAKELCSDFAAYLEWPDDPITILLRHSDCEGQMTPEECHACWPRLAELIQPWDDSDYDKQQAKLLVAGMMKSVEANIPLKFT